MADAIFPQGIVYGRQAPRGGGNRPQGPRGRVYLGQNRAVVVNPWIDEGSPTIDPAADRGDGTAVRDDGAYQVGRGGHRSVEAVIRGRPIETSHLTETREDLVQGGKTQVIARSGNQVPEEVGEDDDGVLGEVAAAPAFAPAPAPSPWLKYALLAGAIAAVALLLKRR